MVASNGPTLRLSAERVQAARNRPNNQPGGVYVSRAVAPEPVRHRSVAERRVDRLRDLARAGNLAAVAAGAQGVERQELTSAAYDVVWPIVFARLTRRLEQLRGHPACAAGVDRLADDCLDRFHDDVEAVVDDLLAHARQPVLQLEAWIAGRINAATVDAHRRRRGGRGALQRPRLPVWVADGLGRDEWLMVLATEMLVWVGVGSTAGNELWPLESWAQRRSARTGDWLGSDPAAVAREVELVLTVMRRRPDWYEAYVERPLGAKQAPVAVSSIGEATGEVARPLALAEPDGHIESELLRLAAEAVREIDSRLAHGGRAEAVVIDVIRAVFGGTFTASLEHAPHTAADPLGGVSGALANVGTVNRIVATVLGIIGDKHLRTPGTPPS